MTTKELNIGIVGYGFMGRTHSNAFRQAPQFFDLPYRPVLKAVCARNAERVKGFAENWGYQSIETDWRAMIARKDIDVIDIASPNDTHAEIAIAAAKAGKMVLCEKPLGRTAQEAMEHSSQSPSTHSGQSHSQSPSLVERFFKASIRDRTSTGTPSGNSERSASVFVPG